MRYVIFLAVMAMMAGPAAAEPTRVEVSVLAHGAKFIGDKTGGARIVIAELQSGEVLAEGVTRGGTGDTDLIMRDSHGHWADVADDSAASFNTTLDIDEPVQLAITASGPVHASGEPARTSMVTWLLPGEDMAGENRMLLELHGYLVTLEKEAIRADGTGHVVVDLALLCGCPVIPDGLWDANRIDMHARLVGEHGSDVVDLEHTGQGTLYKAGFTGAVGKPEAVEFILRGRDDANVAFQRHELEF